MEPSINIKPTQPFGAEKEAAAPGINVKPTPSFATEKEAAAQKEGPVARAIETRTAQLPSDVFLWGALASMGVSLALQFSGNKKTKHVSSFIGQWAPTLLVLGLYNKIVKVAGHDRQS